MNKKAIVLCSGGIDSAVTMAICKTSGHEILALTFDYKQKHRIELISAQKIVQSFGAKKHIMFSLNLKSITNVWQSLNFSDYHSKMSSTYVPARNLIFLSLAYAFAETEKAKSIFIGVSKDDFSDYPDCRPVFIEALEKVFAVGTKTGTEGDLISIETPLILQSKKRIIQRGLDLGVDFSQTWSCYSPVEKVEGVFACGQCGSCLLRLQGFSEVGKEDPIQYI